MDTAPATPASLRRRATPGEHTAIGALAGVVEVTIMQPTVAMKNALQAGRPIPWVPKELYRGYAVNASSFAPITAIQFGANRAYEAALTAVGFAPGAAGATLTAAAAAGATSTLVGNPAELLMIRQQQHHTGLVAEARDVVARFGVGGLYRGMTMALARESFYAGCYLGVCPLLRTRLDDALSGPGAPPSTTSLIAGGAAAGLLATVLSQPFDTVKTRMQAFMCGGPEGQYATARSTAAAIAAEGGGYSALWAGLLPRGVRIVGAVMILSTVRGQAVALIER